MLSAQKQQTTTSATLSPSLIGMASLLPSGFSYTAPRISADSLETEKAKLSEEERNEIIRDLYGQQRNEEEAKKRQPRMNNITKNDEGQHLSSITSTNPLRSQDQPRDHQEQSSQEQGVAGEGGDDDLATAATDTSSASPSDSADENDNQERRRRRRMQEQKLAELQFALQGLVEDPSVDSNAYEQAVRACPGYVRDPAFQRMFLAADRFVVQDAARRMLKYWTYKLRLFGSEVGLRGSPVTMDDLSEDDLATMENNGFQLLPRKDKSGRHILLSTRQNYRYQQRENIGRLEWYLAHVALEDSDGDELSAPSSVVMVLFDDGPYDLRKHHDRKMGKLMIELATVALPIRVVGLHHCFDSKTFEIFLPIFLFMLGSKFRHRYQLHPGNRRAGRMEKLAEFGLEKSVLPTRMGGTLDFNIQTWMEERRRLEEGRRAYDA